jgi:single-stranded-DNA-specific exonuclease
VGTVADLAPLHGENRALVQSGLGLLNASQSPSEQGLRPGLRALVEAAAIAPGRIGSAAIAFGLGPRLNAAGRLDSPETAYRLLVSREEQEARSLAGELNVANRRRQSMTREMVERARVLGIGPGALPEVILASDPGFSPGIVGLAAARLAEEYYRPAIVITAGEETARGSGRSIPEFSIIDALDACADLLVEFGGHAAAAGFTVRSQDLEALLQRLSQQARAALSGIDLKPRLAIDALVEFEELGWPLMELLEAFEPCGYGNPVPILAAEGVGVFYSRVVGPERNHLKMVLRQGSRGLEAIAFGKGHLFGQLPRFVDVAFQLARNEYMGVPGLQLNVQDIRPAGEGEWQES